MAEKQALSVNISHTSVTNASSWVLPLPVVPSASSPRYRRQARRQPMRYLHHPQRSTSSSPHASPPGRNVYRLLGLLLFACAALYRARPPKKQYIRNVPGVNGDITHDVELVFALFVFDILVYLFEPSREGAPAFRHRTVPYKHVPLVRG